MVVFLLIGINNESNSFFFDDLGMIYLLELRYLEVDLGECLPFFMAAATTSLLNGLCSLFFDLNLLLSPTKPGSYLFVWALEFDIKDS